MIELAWVLGYFLISLVAAIPITKIHLKFFSNGQADEPELDVDNKQQIVFFSVLWPFAILFGIGCLVIKLYGILINWTINISK